MILPGPIALKARHENPKREAIHFAPSALKFAITAGTWAVGPGFFISRRWRLEIADFTCRILMNALRFELRC